MKHMKADLIIVHKYDVNHAYVRILSNDSNKINVRKNGPTVLHALLMAHLPKPV